MSEIVGLIRAKVKRVLASGSLDEDDRRAGEQGLLPLFDDLAYRYYLRDDGAVFIIDALEPEAGLQQMTDPRWQLAIHRIVVEEDPQLMELIPPRPSNMVDCATCSGTGRAAVQAIGDAISSTICLNCRGTGWVSASEAAV